MKVRASKTCEAQIAGKWQTVSLDEARGTFRDAPIRCPACHGAVYVAGHYTGGDKFFFAHRKRHSGCPLLSRGFSGMPSPHPDALS